VHPLATALAPGFAWETTPLAVLLVGLDGTIHAANAAAARLGGASAAALRGAPIGRLAPMLGAEWASLVDVVRRDGPQTGSVAAEGPGRRSLAFALSLAAAIDDVLRHRPGAEARRRAVGG